MGWGVEGGKGVEVGGETKKKKFFAGFICLGWEVV